MKSTEFKPSRKFLDTIAHKTPMQQARAIDRWQMMRLRQEQQAFDRAMVRDGIATGSFYSNLHDLRRI